MDINELAQVNAKRLSAVHPYVTYLGYQLVTRLHAEGIELEVTQALRSWNEQQQLYDKGRTAPGPKVTDCQPGHSWHNFGLAIDVCPLDAKLDPDWNDRHPAWARICEVGLELGFVMGAKWRVHPDEPHAEYTGRYPSMVPDEVRREYMDAGGGLPGIAAVWRAAKLPDPPAIDPAAGGATDGAA